MRKCIQFKVEGQWLRGIYHEPSGPAAGDSESGRIGVLFSNPGWHPRSGHGDLSAHLADAFARDGYWAFRFDMPGLGDSDGDVPKELTPLLHIIKMGGHGPVIHSLATELKKQYGLEKIILGGHCGSAMTALYATMLDDHNLVSGLVLLEMVFDGVPDATPSNGAGGQSPIRGGLGQARQLAKRLILKTPGGERIRSLYRQSREAKEKLRGLEIPANSNTKLLETWRRVMDKRLPTLVISARHPAFQLKFDYLAYMKLEQHPGTRSVIVEGTTHAFLQGNGMKAVQTHCENWLREYFPTRTAAVSAG